MYPVICYTKNSCDMVQPMPSRDPEKIKAAQKRYYEKNKEKMYQRQREWYHANKDRPEIKEMYQTANKRWREEHRDQYLASKRASSKRYYDTHKEEERERNRIKRARQVAHLMAIANEARSSGCLSCGETDVDVLEFHHVDPSQKKCSIAEMIRIKNPTEQELRDEISKCVVLCANHHRKVERGTLSLPE